MPETLSRDFEKKKGFSFDRGWRKSANAPLK
jgi:hypothetical protein